MVLDTREINQKWFIKSRNCYSNDIIKYNSSLFKICRKNKLKIKPLGRIVEEQMYFISKSKINTQNKNVLVIGGIHGDEPAGCWGILSFLENADINLFEKVNVYIIPIFNPTGFKLGGINNVFEESTNEGYFQDKKRQKLSKEGKIIVDAKLEKLNFSGLLTLHEDYDQDKRYVYCWEDLSNPGDFSKFMSNSDKGIFKRYSGIADGFKVKRGIVFNLQNYEIWAMDEIDSLEFYFFRKGVKHVAASEVPRISNIDKRILACKNIVENFIKYYSNT